MIYIIILIIIFILINLNKKEGLKILSSEVYNNIRYICDKDTISYFNNLDISPNAKIQNKILNKYIYDSIYPIGSFYVQYPEPNNNMQFPIDKSPDNLFPDTKWEEQWASESIFFRTEGELSNIGRKDGLQDYAIKKIYGKMSWVQTDYNNMGRGNTGVFGIKANTIITHNDDDAGSDKGHRNYFDSLLSLPNNTSEKETRVKNRIIKIWKRIS